jgi:peptidoglycan/xylan/chitin deacetylase (PgdA/CDA1 family)
MEEHILNKAFTHLLIALIVTLFVSGCSNSRADQPLDALDGPDKTHVNLSPDPTLDATGLVGDMVEIQAIPITDCSQDYLDLFNDQPRAEITYPADGENKISILMYHGFTSGPARNRYQTSIMDFRAQLEFLKQNEIPVIALGTLVDAYKSGDWSKVPPRAVVITMDDGQRNNYTLAYPVCKKMGAPFTLAIYTNNVGRPGALQWDELKEMMANGAEIGCHSASHPGFRKNTINLTGAAFTNFMEREAVVPRTILEQGTGKPIRYFFYPYGTYSKQTQEYLIKAGYEGIMTTNDGFTYPKNLATELKRNEVSKGITMQRFKSMTIGS